MNFTKKDTLCMKGIAILMMFFHHNYLDPSRWIGASISFYPFAQHQIMYVAKFFKICVGLFVFLTGYGMMVSVKQKKYSDKDMRKYVLNRYLSMMMGFWLIFLLVHILSAIFTSRIQRIYGTGLSAIVYFIIDGMGLAKLFHTATFNDTWWYMSLATILILIFPMFKKLIEKYQGIWLILTLFIPKALDLPYCELWRWLFCYSLGMYMAEHNLIARIKEKIISKNIWQRILIFAVMTFAMFALVRLRQSSTFAVKLLYLWEGIVPAYTIIYGYTFFMWCKPLTAILQFLGKHSMNMFLVHTMFRAVYFHEFIYSFYSMWLDYLVLIVVSVAASIAIELFKKLIHYGDITIYVKNKVTSILKLE